MKLDDIAKAKIKCDEIIRKLFPELADYIKLDYGFYDDTLTATIRVGDLSVGYSISSWHFFQAKDQLGHVEYAVKHMIYIAQQKISLDRYHRLWVEANNARKLKDEITHWKMEFSRLCNDYNARRELLDECQQQLDIYRDDLDGTRQELSDISGKWYVRLGRWIESLQKRRRRQSERTVGDEQ